MKLNGWQRVGVALSALWLLIALVLVGIEVPADKFIVGWLLAALLIPICWALAYATIFAIRWIRNGFISDRKSRSPVEGEPVSAPTKAPNELAQAVSDVTAKPDSAPLSPIKPPAPTLQRIAILVTFLLMIYAAVLIYALDGGIFTFKGNELGFFLISGGIAFWYLWRGLNRRGWVGAIVGAAVSLCILFLAAGISGYVSGQPTYILEHEPILMAIKKSYPEDYDAILRVLVAKFKDKNLGRDKLAENFTAEMAPAITAVWKKALPTTSDDALLQFAIARVQLFREVAASSADDCVLLMRGQVANADYQTQKRIMAIPSKETKDANRDASVRVINDANTYSNVAGTHDQGRFNALYGQLDAKLKSSYGTSADYLFGDDSLNKPAFVDPFAKPLVKEKPAMTNEIRCNAGLLWFKEVLNLPPKDRSFMLRMVLGSE